MFDLDRQGTYECVIDMLEILRGAVVLTLGLIRKASKGIRTYTMLEHFLIPYFYTNVRLIFV